MREIARARYVRLEFNGRDVWNISELSVAKKKIRYNKLRKFQNRRIENSPQNKGQGQRHLVE